MKLPVTYELDNFNLCAVLIHRLKSETWIELKMSPKPELLGGREGKTW